MWRKGWVPAGTTEATPLCNACGLLCAPRPPRVPAHAPRVPVVFVRFSNEASSRLRFPFLKHAFSFASTERHVSAARRLRRRDGPPPPSARSRARSVAPSRHTSFRSGTGTSAAGSARGARRLPQARGGRGTPVLPGAAPPPSSGSVRPVRPLVPVLQLANTPRAWEGTRGGVAEASRPRGAEDDPRTTTRRTYHALRVARATEATSSRRPRPVLGAPLLSRRRRDARLRRRRAPPTVPARARKGRAGAETHAETHAETRKRERRRRGRDAPPPPAAAALPRRAARERAPSLGPRRRSRKLPGESRSPGARKRLCPRRRLRRNRVEGCARTS